MMEVIYPNMFGEHQALDNVTVIEVGNYLTAPKPARILAEFGAKVIKIERPTGAPHRQASSSESHDIPPLFAIVNSGKKSIGIDLSTDSGREVFLRLAQNADVLIENKAPGVMEKLQLSYKDVQKVNNDIIYCSISGYGETGPLSDRKAVDFMIQGMSGLAYQNGLRRGDGTPSLSGWFMADELTSAYVTISIMAALINGDGTHIDISLFDVLMGSFSAKAARHHTDQEITPPGSKGHREGPRGLYETATEPLTLDVLPAVRERFLTLWNILGLDEWVQAERYATVDEIFENKEHVERRVKEQFKSRPQEYWLDKLLDAGFIAAPVLTVEEAFEHEQMDYRSVLSTEVDERVGEYLQLNFPAMYSDLDMGVSTPVPLLGEHTRELLEQSGYTESEIESLYNQDIIV